MHFSDISLAPSGIDSLTGKPKAVAQGGTVMVFKLVK